MKKKVPIRKNNIKKSNFKKHMVVLLGVFLMISLVAFGYFLGQHEKSTVSIKSPTVKKELSAAKTLEENLSKVATKNPEKSVVKEPSIASMVYTEHEVAPKVSLPAEKTQKQDPSSDKQREE